MRKFLLLIVALVCFVSVNAQVNANSFKVDDLTDAQVEQYMKRAELMGYSEAQLPEFARAQGISSAEVKKMQDRLQKIKSKGSSSATGSKDLDVKNNAKGRQVSGRSEDKPKRFFNEQDSLQHRQDSIIALAKPKVFGADLFKNNATTFEPNLRLATPSSYIIGPDDEILLDITGNNEASYRLPVSPEGNIKVDYVGVINVAGLSVASAKSKISQRLSTVYSAIRSGATKIDVNIGNIRSINVTLTGAVTKPGTYTLPSLATVFNALYASGGPAENGSYRTIQVIRNNRVISTIDVYDFLVNGMQKGNIRLQDQDIIHIPVYANRVSFEGEVKRPAIFEIVSGESLQDLLNYAGGFAENGFAAKVKVFQKTDRERKITDVYANQYANYEPKNGDHFIAEELLARYENRVSILGAVFRPGAYGLEPGMTLRTLLEKAQGLREDAFMDRGLINRLATDNTLQLINFNVRDIMSGAATDVPLRREDKIVISSIFDLRDEYKITVQGQVRLPGDFPFASKATLADVIQQAGGLTEEAKNARVEIARRIRNRGAQDSISAATILVNIREGKLESPYIELKPYDVISILGDANFREQRQVKVEGEVMYPGIYTINREDERISDIIARAGGLTSYAYTEGASLRRTGASKLKREAEKEKERKLSAEGKDGDVEHDFDETSAVGSTKAANANKQALNKVSQSGDVETVITEPSDLVGIELHKILAKPNATNDLFLMDGDIILVPKEIQTVRVMGEVLNPNNVVYQKGKSLSYYVNQAGGFTTEALKKKVFVQYANGSVKGRSGGYPEIKPGSEIVVPKRAPRERMSAQSWIGMGTGIASLAAIIVSLLR